MKQNAKIEKLKYTRKLLILVLMIELLIIIRSSGYVLGHALMRIGGFEPSYGVQILSVVLMLCFMTFPFVLISVIYFCVEISKLKKKRK